MAEKLTENCSFPGGAKESTRRMYGEPGFFSLTHDRIPQSHQLRASLKMLSATFWTTHNFRPLNSIQNSDN